MGHVSDFNGLNTREETGLSQPTSDFMSTDNILDSPLNENFMPIYNSFPDDIYQQPHLYGSSNLSSFMNNDDDRNGYLDEQLELDLLFDSNFMGFDPPETLQQDESPAANNDANGLYNEENVDVGNDCSVSVNQGVAEDQNVQRTAEVEYPSPNSQEMNFDSQESDQNIDNIEPVQSSDLETYTDEQVVTDPPAIDQKSELIPKLVIKIKTELPSTDEDSSFAEVSSPFTNADKVKLGKRRNKRDGAGKTKVKDPNKHKSHKKKSRHKKRDSKHDAKSTVHEISENLNRKLPNYNTVDYTGEKMLLNQNMHVNIDIDDSKTSPKIKNGVNGQVSSANSVKKSSSSVNKDFYYCDNVNTPNDFKFESLNDEVVKKELVEQSPLTDAVDFQFEFENTHAFSMSPSDDDHKSKREAITPVNDFSPDITASVDDKDIPDSNSSLSEEDQSVEKPFSNGIEKQNSNSETKVENSVTENEVNKSSSASELIEELHAHHQQVFEEIEIATPDLELEFHSAKNSTDNSYVASHSNQNSANAETSPSKTVAGCGENDMNSSNHLSANKTSPLTSQTGSAFCSIASSRGGTTTQSRNISSSSSSITGKSSTSHRSYRKRRRSDSSSSSSSDREKFYNRPVKYDPVTQTYCDEFGREIRPDKLKYYLNAKSSRRDSHSNNGSSSGSRSKSPRYRSHHRKYRKSRSSSRSHRRQRHSSSRSSSRSHGRRYKDESDRKYRSPSPKHRGKRHYLDVEENMRAYEERRVMYVGDIPPDYTVEQLKERFGRFGSIQSASIKSKFTADGSLYIFGFVTFKNRSDVCQAIERGNENPSWPRFDLNFGGRRRFCNGNYTDLDGKVAEAESGWYGHHQTSYRKPPQEDDFTALLRQEQRRLGMSKK